MRNILPLVLAGLLLAGVSLSAVAGHDGRRAGWAAPGAPSVQYHGKHGGIGFSLPAYRQYRQRDRAIYFGRPGTVIQERRWAAPGVSSRNRGHRYQPQTLWRCGPNHCTRVR